MTYYKSSGLGDAIASEMMKVMDSDEHKALFQKKASVKKEAQDPNDPLAMMEGKSTTGLGSGKAPTLTDETAKYVAQGGGSQTAAQGTPGTPGAHISGTYTPKSGPSGVAGTQESYSASKSQRPGNPLAIKTPTGVPLDTTDQSVTTPSTTPQNATASAMIESIIRVAEYCDEKGMKLSEKYATRLLQSIIVEAKKAKKCKECDECGEKSDNCKCCGDKKKAKK